MMTATTANHRITDEVNGIGDGRVSGGSAQVSHDEVFQHHSRHHPKPANNETD